jgi:hypothetical protein
MPPVSLTMQAFQATGAAVGSAVTSAVGSGVTTGADVGDGDAPPPHADTKIAADATSAAALPEMRKAFLLQFGGPDEQRSRDEPLAHFRCAFHDQVTVSGEIPSRR